MRYLLIDTCILNQAVTAATDDFYEIATLSTTRGMRLIVPEVLIREHCGKLYRDFGDTVEKRRAQRCSDLLQYLRIDVRQPAEIVKKSILSVYPSALKARLRHLFRYVVPVGYPQIDSQTLLDRAVFREKPFHTKGFGNVGDWLLWISAVSLMKEGDSLEFVTNNVQDFVDKPECSQAQNRFSLSPSLAGLPSGRGVFTGTVYRSITDMLTAYGVADDADIGVFEARHPKALLFKELFPNLRHLISSQLQAYEYPAHCVTQDIGAMRFDVAKAVRVDTRPSIDIFAVNYAVRLPVYLSSDASKVENKMAELKKSVAILSVWTKMTVSQRGDVRLEKIVGSRLKSVEGYERAFSDSAHIFMMLGEFSSDDEPYLDKAGG